MNTIFTITKNDKTAAVSNNIQEAAQLLTEIMENNDYIEYITKLKEEFGEASLEKKFCLNENVCITLQRKSI